MEPPRGHGSPPVGCRGYQCSAAAFPQRKSPEGDCSAQTERTCRDTQSLLSLSRAHMGYSVSNQARVYEHMVCTHSYVYKHMDTIDLQRRKYSNTLPRAPLKCFPRLAREAGSGVAKSCELRLPEALKPRPVHLLRGESRNVV